MNIFNVRAPTIQEAPNNQQNKLQITKSYQQSSNKYLTPHGKATKVNTYYKPRGINRYRLPEETMLLKNSQVPGVANNWPKGESVIDNK